MVIWLILIANWPCFRGPEASGVADGEKLPTSWDLESGSNIAWKMPIEGLAHASPIVWGEQIIVATAVSSQGRAYLKHGLYGSGDADSDRSKHQWLLLSFNLQNGEPLWRRVITEGEPIDKRHIKATYANSTPATDGLHVVVLFGSQGLFCTDMQGTLIWKKDLGRMDMGAYDAPTYEWGPASSPIIFKDMVIVQCDTQAEDFIAAFDVNTGRELWRTARDELPSWGTPNVFSHANQPELVANGSNFIMGYDPTTGKELWRLGGSSQITAPTPVFNKSLIIVTSGRRPEKPIFALRPGARGDLTLTETRPTNDYVAWHEQGSGPYMPTPLIYGEYLYCLQNQGILDCYAIETGERLYRTRLQHGGGGFSASPVASDNHLYLSGEDGDVFVVKAGAEYEWLSVQSLGEVIMATPAIAKNTLIIRGRDHLFAIRASE